MSEPNKRDTIDAILSDEVYYNKHEEKYDYGDAVSKLMEIDKLTWNSAIDEVLKIWDDIGPEETDVEIGERFRSLKK